MTIKVGDYAIWHGSYRPVVVEITKITEKQVRFKEGVYRERRGDLVQVLAYGSDKVKLEQAVERMVSAASEARRRRSSAGQYERDEIARIAKECMA